MRIFKKNKRPTQRVGLLLENYEKRIYEKTHTCNINVREKALAKASAFSGGGWWIRTTEVSDNRFTVCPLWPLGKSPKKMELVIGVEPTTC